MLRSLAPVLLLAACSNDYTFPGGAGPFESAPPGDIGTWLSLDTTPDGSRMTMAYYDRVAGAVMYAVGSPNTTGGFDWVYEQVDGWAGSNGLDPGDRGKYASQRTAPDGTVWLAYGDANGGLWVAHRTGGPVWVVEQADPAGGQWVSLALDAAGEPVIAHHDPTRGALRVTRHKDSTWSTEEAYVGELFNGTDDEGNAVLRPAAAGQYADIDITDGEERIAFYDAAQLELVLLEGGEGTWQDSIVDGAGASTQGRVDDAGAWPQLRVDGGELAIAYQDVGAQNLRYATRKGAGWTVETVDPTAWRGADTALFGRNGAAAIVYQDGYDTNQILAEKQANGTWKITKLLGDDGAVGFHNEVVEVAGKTWVGSYDFTHHALALTSLE
jgi:hypothetical protein